MRFLLQVLIAAMLLLIHVASHAGQPCEVVPMPCTFEATAFKFRVIDSETKQPVADAHALAEWQVRGAGGRLNGPLMVLDGTSASDGTVAFPAWGPLQGPSLGIGVGRDPIITLFKSGYEALLIGNRFAGPAREREQVRRFAQDGRTYELKRFKGTPEQWLEELDRVWLGVAVSRSDEDTLKFREPYLNRLRRVAAERPRIASSRTRGAEAFLRNIQRELNLLERRPQ